MVSRYAHSSGALRSCEQFANNFDIIIRNAIVNDCNGSHTIDTYCIPVSSLQNGPKKQSLCEEFYSCIEYVMPTG